MDETEWPPEYGETAPSPEQIYWDRRAETMSPGERESVVLRKLRRQLRYAYDNSEFYR